MYRVEELTIFFVTIRSDNRIGISHVSLHMALFHFYNLNQRQSPFSINKGDVMEAAKINGVATFHNV